MTTTLIPTSFQLKTARLCAAAKIPCRFSGNWVQLYSQGYGWQSIYTEMGVADFVKINAGRDYGPL